MIKITGYKLQQTLPWLLLIAGIIGCLVSFELTYDKVQVLKNPSYKPSCSLNPVLSCGSVMKTKQANLLGVPNTIFGLMGFSAVTALSISLLAGAKFKSWLWKIINAGMLVAFAMFIYLFFQAVFRIHAICPFCFVIWMIVPPMLWYTTLYNLKEGNIKARFLNSKFKKWLSLHHGDILLAWYAVVFLILLTRFWYYWKTLV